MYKKISTIILFFHFNLNSIITANFNLKNKTKYELGVYIDNSNIFEKECEDQTGNLLYCIIKPDMQEFIKLENIIKEINDNKIIHDKSTKKIICDYTKGKNFIVEFTIIDSYDEFETEVKIPIYNEKNQVIRYKVEKLKIKKPIHKIISESHEIINNAQYEITYDEQNKKLEINHAY